MIRLLILLILAAIAITIAYFQFQAVPTAKKMILLGGSIAAAAIGLFMQSSFPFYMSLLGLVAVSLLATLIFMKWSEKEQQKKLRLLEERRASREQLFSAGPPKAEAVYENTTNKSFGMQSIDPNRKES